ncbi:endonuclease [Endozoicomonas sp. OPT23]|nr:endonuclease [Endozoicomonas sp. OPT23]
MKQNLALTALASAVMAASSVAPADLIISEYVEGTGYNKAIELFNTGDVAVDLARYKLVMFDEGNKSKVNEVSLTGSLEPNQIYLIAKSNKNNKTPLKLKTDGGKADSVSSSKFFNFNGDDPVELQLQDGTTVDAVAAKKDTSLSRKVGVATPSEAFDADQWSEVKITKDYTYNQLGFRPGEQGAEPTPPTPPTAWDSSSATITPINEIQGDSFRSPEVPDGKYESEDEYAVQGIVTKKVSTLYKGFFLQEETGDGNDKTSEGIFIYTGGAALAGLDEGDRVVVKGKVKENYGQTQINIGKTDKGALKFDVKAKAATPEITPVELIFGSSETLKSQLEKYEGMLVSTTDSNLVVTRNFGFDFDGFRNNMVLSLEKPLYKPTQKHAALSDEAKALAAKNTSNQLYVETDEKPANGVIPYFTEFDADNDYILIGDKVDKLEGVLGYSHDQFRLVAKTGENLEAGNFVHKFSKRTLEPKAKKGENLRIASFNVLNYFNKSVGGDDNPSSGNQNRGASSETDFAKQRTKIINAMVAMDADVIGLMEIENNGFGEKSAIQDLLNGLNAEMAQGNEYAFVKSPDGGVVGSDAIAVGMIYRPGKVALKGASEVIVMPSQSFTYQGKLKGETTEKTQNKYQRNSLLQTFVVKVDGKEQPYEFTAVVNHFKSKGSECHNDYAEYKGFGNAADGIPIKLSKGSYKIDKTNRNEKATRIDQYQEDLQGSCNEFRVSAAETLGKYLKANNDGENVLILGDLNAYGKEDPVRLLTDYQWKDGDRKLTTAPYTKIGTADLDGESGRALTQGFGYVNLADHVAERENETDVFSYSYGGELGSLDHVLASQKMIDENVIADVTDWHINSVENSLFEYSREYSGSIEKSDNVYSSSDHDPVLIDLNLGGEVVRPEPAEPSSGSANSSGGGSFGFPMLGLGLLSLFGLRRKRKV